MEMSKFTFRGFSTILRATDCRRPAGSASSAWAAVFSSGETSPIDCFSVIMAQTWSNQRNRFMHDENWMMVMMKNKGFEGAGAGLPHNTISALGSPHFAKTDLPADLLVFVSALEDLHQLRRLQLAGRQLGDRYNRHGPTSALRSAISTH